MKLRLAVDTGGTFTDLVLTDEDSGMLWTDKVPSTPDNPARACILGTERILSKAGAVASDLKLYLHGTTVATNALLEYKGAYEGSANYNVTNGRDPAKAMNFAPIPSQAWVGANHDFENLLGYVRKLFKKTTERHAPRVNRKK